MPAEPTPETGTPDPATPPPATPDPAPATPPPAAPPEKPATPDPKATEPIQLPDDHPLVKAYADTKAKLRKREDAELDEQQRLTRDLEEATKRGDTLAVENARLKAAIDHGLSAEDLELLGSGSAEDIAKRAKALADRLGSSGRRPAPDPTQGNRNPAPAGGTVDIDAIPSAL